MSEVQTSRFGTIDVDDERVLTFANGLLGFSNRKRFCLLEPTQDACFFWLQSLDDPSLAFVVTDPTLFVHDYQVPIHGDQLASRGLRTTNDAQVFVVVNKADHSLTGNLLGPLVINTINKRGEQIVLGGEWTTRHVLVGVPA